MNIIKRMNKYHIPNLGKACEVLNLIAANQNALVLKDVVERLEIPRTTALRITQTLLDAEYLTRTEDGTFTLGTALVQLGVLALDSLDIRTYARPVLRSLSADTGESSHIAMLSGEKSLLVEVCDSPHPVRIASRPGTLVDLHSSSTGKVFLAFSIPEPAVFCSNLDLTAHTGHTHTTPEAVLAEIEAIRANGYAIDDEEYVPGVRCIAAPIMNAFGKTIAAVGITASTRTFTPAKVPRISTRLCEAATEISQRMGFTHP